MDASHVSGHCISETNRVWAYVLLNTNMKLYVRSPATPADLTLIDFHVSSRYVLEKCTITSYVTIEH